MPDWALLRADTWSSLTDVVVLALCYLSDQNLASEADLTSSLMSNWRPCSCLLVLSSAARATHPTTS